MTKSLITIDPFSRNKSQVFIHEENLLFHMVSSEEEVIAIVGITSSVLENKAREKR